MDARRKAEVTCQQCGESFQAERFQFPPEPWPTQCPKCREEYLAERFRVIRNLMAKLYAQPVIEVRVSRSERRAGLYATLKRIADTERS